MGERGASSVGKGLAWQQEAFILLPLFVGTTAL